MGKENASATEHRSALQGAGDRPTLSSDSQATLFRLIADHTTDAALRLDGKGIVRFANGASKGMFGYAPEEILGKPVSRLLTKNAVRMFEQKLTVAVRATGTDPEGSSPRETLSLRALHKDGRHFPAELFLVVYRAESGLEALVLVKDLTHQETVAQELEKLIRKYFPKERGQPFFSDIRNTIKVRKSTATINLLSGATKKETVSIRQNPSSISPVQPKQGK